MFKKYELKINEVNFIIEDITKKGIVNEDVKDDILDHVCCIIENEMKPDMDFYKLYETTISKFYLNHLNEIEEELNLLLKFKNYYKMKRILKISGLISVLLFITGSILKAFHLPGAGITIVLGLSFFSLIFIPLFIVLKFKDDKEKNKKGLQILALVILSVCTIGVLFKLMHWQGANVILVLSMVFFAFIFIPIYFITNYRDINKRFDAIINTTLMLAGVFMLFSLINLGYSKKHIQNSKVKTELKYQTINLK